MRNYGYRYILNQKFLERGKVNIAYSLRAFSRDLEVAPQVLSLVLNNKRNLPEKYTESFIEKLELNYREELLFRQNIVNERGNLSKLEKTRPDTQEIVHEEIHHKLISDWEYYAVYTLLETGMGFSTTKQVAEKLGLDEKLAQIILSELEELGLIEVRNGDYQHSGLELNTSWNIPNRTLRIAQKKNMDLAKSLIDKLPSERKQYSSATFPIEEKKVDEVRKMIQEFQNKLSKYVRTDQADSVYQLNIQFFALTDNQQNGEQT